MRELEPTEGASPVAASRAQSSTAGEDFDRVTRGTASSRPRRTGGWSGCCAQTGVPAGPPLQRPRAAPHLRAARRELGLARLPRRGHGPDRRPADLAALRLLLSEQRLLACRATQRLAALLEDSRKFQNEVSERLAEQVLHALYELLARLPGGPRRVRAASSCASRSPSTPTRSTARCSPCILRLVFLLYAEERDMLPEDETYLRYYSLAGLYERLREDAALIPGHDGPALRRLGAAPRPLPHDPRRRRRRRDAASASATASSSTPTASRSSKAAPGAGARQIDERIEPPLVPDGTIYRALEKLLVLDGERISYRALDVEQIGSVYETMMGFRLETATGRSVAIKAQKKHGAPTAVDLEALLAEPRPKRAKWLQDRADRKLTDKVEEGASRMPTTLEDLHAALSPVVDAAATPDLVPPGAMVLQPSEERRRSGSHYTPRVAHRADRAHDARADPRAAARRGRASRRRPEQILDLKVCDPAMGSGAFLVEACRQLGDALVEAWHAHGAMPAIPPDEDEVIFARRLVAQRCLYGVDRNPVAVDLAKMSLWLVTLAREHALTFVDHALRHGDSLVGLVARADRGLPLGSRALASEPVSRHAMREQRRSLRRLAPADPRGRRDRH